MRSRIRSIVMTAAMAAIGLMPAAMSHGIGSESQRPLAIVIIGGLIILGEYYLFKSYLANVTSFSLDVIMPLGFMAIGIAVGIVVSAKLCSYFTKTHKAGFLSLILGLIVASSLVLIPFDVSYNLSLVVTSIIAVILGGIIVLGLSKIQ